MARGGFRRRRWFRCWLCPRIRRHPLVLHESIPSPTQQSAGLHGHARIPQPSPPPPPASPSGHQRPLLAPQLPGRPRVPFHRGARHRIQADGPGGAADESQRARQHPLLAYMTTTVPAPHYALTEPKHITFLTHTQSPMYTPTSAYDSNISS